MNTILNQDKEQLQENITILTEEKGQLQERNTILVQKMDQLQRRDTPWKCFGSSQYYISRDMRSWNESKQQCMDLGAHLVIIDSEEEQEFIHALINQPYIYDKRAWIGLSDLETEGTWKWVDGKVLDTPG